MHYVLSDIHGNKEAFDTLLSLIQMQPDDHLYILGDVIDRGPDGIRLLQQIRAMQNCTLLLGNHEYMMVDCLRHPDDAEKTLRWMDNSCEDTFMHLSEFSQEELEDLLSYVESLPVQAEITVGGKAFLLVHAAPAELYDAGDSIYDNCTEFMVWHRLQNTDTLPEGKTVVFGHTPTWYFRSTPLPSAFIFHGRRMIGIDCGCGFPHLGGQLGCIRLEDMTEYYSEDGIMEPLEPEN